MSDGPHRSLPMKPRWRSVAERACNGAFGVDEISVAMMPALLADCQDEMTPRFIGQLRSLCEQHETLLIKTTCRCGWKPCGRKPVMGWADGFLKTSPDSQSKRNSAVFTLAEAIEDACVERLAKSNRQMEEHTLRKSSVSRANDLRNRLEQATAKAEAPVAGLARQLLKLDNNRPARSSTKRDGLDEGPSIK
jgi:hypothetical protein